MDGIHGTAATGDSEVLHRAVVDTIIHRNWCGSTVSVGSVTRVADSHLDRNSGRGTAIISHRSDKLDRSEVHRKHRHLIGTHTWGCGIACVSEHINCHLGDNHTYVTQQVAERTKVDKRTIGEDRITHHRTLVDGDGGTPTIQVEIVCT